MWSTMEAAAVGYLAGSIPFAFLVARRLRGVDLRVAGSGNIGAANVLRTSGAPLGVAAMALDIAKGVAAVWLAGRMGADDAGRAAAAAAAVVGHVYPVWLRLRGGKGVATACGAFSLLAPAAMAASAAVFLAVVWRTRYISLGSIAGSAALAVASPLTGRPAPVSLAIAGAAALVVFRHRANLARIQAGTERRIGDRVWGGTRLASRGGRG